MSQKRTIIQGLEPADGQSYDNSDGVSNFYTPNREPNSRGTVVPGMPGRKGPNDSVHARAERGSEPQSARSTGKPIHGFLYSISRTPYGEFWPLQIGPNTIGTGKSCDIILKEGTVSHEHAVLVVRKMKNTDKIIASINDARSTNGTLLNGESLGFNPVECHNSDIITIGENYELLLILIDSVSLGLSVSKDFIPVNDEEDNANDMPNDNMSGYTRPDDSFQPFKGPDYPYSNSRINDGTVGMDGKSQSDNGGGTVGM